MILPIEKSCATFYFAWQGSEPEKSVLKCFSILITKIAKFNLLIYDCHFCNSLLPFFPLVIYTINLQKLTDIMLVELKSHSNSKIYA